jgi:eukaryotic-like serine/threonine-protein kinase
VGVDSQGQVLAGRYRLLRTIGVGGMARVHLAEDERLGRRVAVKQLHADSPEDAALRFDREAKLGASLNHPNLVSIYDVATDGESVLIVMEYVDGETLQDAIARGSLMPERVVAIVRDVAAGLDHAHSHGVVHRDVKPANILIRHDGVAKLADLGIASAAERTSITRTDTVLGTASYMAPEQLDGRPAGPGTDIYALAAVAFEALSGQKVRSGKTPVEIAHEVVNGPPPDLGEAWSGAPPGAVRALAHGMAREPGDRPASAGALAGELERALRDRRQRPVAPGPRTAATAPLTRRLDAKRPPPRRPGPERTEGESSRRGWLAGALAGLAILVAVVAGVAALSGDGDPGREPSRPAAQANGSGGEGQSGSGESERRRGEGARATPPDDAPSPASTPSATAEDPAALNDQGFELMQEGRYDEAIPLLEQAVAAYPEGSQELTYAYALYNLGRSLRLAGRAAEAVPILERRLQIPNQTETVQRELEAARSQAG